MIWFFNYMNILFFWKKRIKRFGRKFRKWGKALEFIFGLRANLKVCTTGKYLKESYESCYY